MTRARGQPGGAAFPSAAADPERPPLPRLVLRVGLVAGQDAGAAASCAGPVLSAIDRALARLYAATRGRFHAEPPAGAPDARRRGYAIELVAEGSAIEAGAALSSPPHWELARLPEAPPVPGAPPADTTDRLAAVVDVVVALGEPFGKRAPADRGGRVSVPLFVIEAGDTVRLDAPSVAADGTLSPADWREAVDGVVRAAVVPHAPPGGAQTAGWDTFRNERLPRRTGRFVAHDMMQRLLCGQLPRWSIPHDTGKAREQWRSFLAAAPADPVLVATIGGILLPRFLAADTLAVRYAHAYRSDTVLGIALSTVAVLSGLAGIAAGSAGTAAAGWQASFLIGEAGLIGLAIWFVHHGWRERWHERWLAYRYLAERLRHQRVLACLAGAGAGMAADTTPPRNGSPAWADWYLKATARELALPAGPIDGAWLRDLLAATRAGEIDAQIRYARTTARTMNRLDRALRRLSLGAFVLALAAIAAGLALLATGTAVETGTAPAWLARTHRQLAGWLAPALVVLSPGLPALAAAFAALRAKGDYALAASDAEATGDALSQVRGQIDALLENGTPPPAEALALVHRTADILSTDVGVWHRHYRRRPLDVT